MKILTHGPYMDIYIIHTYSFITRALNLSSTVEILTSIFTKFFIIWYNTYKVPKMVYCIYLSLGITPSLVFTQNSEHKWVFLLFAIVQLSCRLIKTKLITLELYLPMGLVMKKCNFMPRMHSGHVWNPPSGFTNKTSQSITWLRLCTYFLGT